MHNKIIKKCTILLKKTIICAIIYIEVSFMSLTKKGYKKRIIDKTIEENLKIFGAISIEEPKWRGKT